MSEASKATAETPRLGASLRTAASRWLKLWWVIPSIWVAQLALAAAFGRWSAAAVSMAMGGHAFVEPDHLVYGLIAIGIKEHSVVVPLLAALVSSATLGGVLWIVLAGGLFRQFESPSHGADLVADGVRCAPFVLLQTFWVTLLRLVCLAPMAAPRTFHPAVDIVAISLFLVTVPAFDLARAEVCLDGEATTLRRLGPRPLLAGLWHTLKNPAYLGVAALAWVIARAISTGMLYLAFTQMTSQGGLWGLRFLALLPLAIGVFRLALASARR